MLQFVYLMAYLGLFSVGGQVFGMYGSFAMVQFGISSSRPQIHSFYDLVTRDKLDDQIFSDSEKLKSFGDINTRYMGYTPLHILIDRPDATVQQIRVLFKCGAKAEIPALVEMKDRSGFYPWPTYKIGFKFSGETPPRKRGNIKQCCNNPDVRSYVFGKMLKKEVKKAIEVAKLENKLEKESEEFFIVPSPRMQDNWSEMGEDEAREHLKASVKDYKELELFVSNLSVGAFDAFLSMQKMTQ